MTHSYRQPPRLTPLVHFVVRNLTVATRVVAPASTRRRWCGSGHWLEGKEDGVGEKSTSECKLHCGRRGVVVGIASKLVG